MNVAVKSEFGLAARLHNIVLLDDAQFDHIALKRSVSRCDFVGDIFHFYAAEELLDFLDTKDRPNIDLLIVDQNMPRMGGLEFLAEARKRHPLGFARLIYLALTLKPENGLIDNVLTHRHVDGWIEKPVTPQSLLRIASEQRATGEADLRFAKDLVGE